MGITTKFRHGLFGAAAIALAFAAGPAKADAIPKGGVSENMKVIGFSGLDGRYGAFKMALNHPSNGRWYLYMGHSFNLGWSILDVTDPANPKILNWIPGPKNTRSGELDIADGKLITAAERSQMGGDTDPNAPWDDGIVVWSLADPVHPMRLGQ